MRAAIFDGRSPFRKTLQHWVDSAESIKGIWCFGTISSGSWEVSRVTYSMTQAGVSLWDRAVGCAETRATPGFPPSGSIPDAAFADWPGCFIVHRVRCGSAKPEEECSPGGS